MCRSFRRELLAAAVKAIGIVATDHPEDMRALVAEAARPALLLVELGRSEVGRISEIVLHPPLHTRQATKKHSGISALSA